MRVAVVLDPIGVVRTGAAEEEVRREPREVRGEVEPGVSETAARLRSSTCAPA